jgi:hypothetical protein
MKNQNQIVITTNGLSNISMIHQEKNFILFNGNRTYLTNSFFADFISPNIAREHLTDPFLSFYRVDVPDPLDSFSDLINYYQTGELIINTENALFFQNIGKALGNHYLVDMSFSLSEQTLTIDNVFNQMRAKITYNGSINKEISFIASNFYKFTLNSLLELEPDLLLSIILSPYLQLETEDTLADLILQHLKNGEVEYKDFLSFLSFENLSDNYMAEILNELKFEDLTEKIWNSFERRLILFNPYYNPRNNIIEEFPPHKSNPFKGIFAGLTQQYGGNPHLNGQINVTSSSSLFNQPHQILNYGWGSSWNTGNVPNSWIQFDFKERRVAITGYSIKTNRGGINCCHLKNWDIQGSLDQKIWIKIDSQKDNDALNDSNKVHTWKCKKSDEFRYIRLIQTGKTHRSDDFLCIGQFELFGTITK